MGTSYSQPSSTPVRWFNDFKANLPKMDDKVVVVTGTTTGTGFIAAGTMLGLGARVFVLNRPSSRADVALEKLQKVNGAEKVTQIDCDLMSFDSVRAAAEKVKAECSESGVNVLCNNAGIMALKDEASPAGYDVQMQVNHLSHFLLTKELFPLLEKAAEKHGEARIVNHTSEARRGAPLAREYLEKNGGNLGGDGASMFFGGARWVRYHHTKLANYVFTFALDDRLRAKNSKVKALCAHPGLAATNLQVTTNQDGGMGPFMTKLLFALIGQSGPDGTMPLLSACCAKDAHSGTFYGPKSIGYGVPVEVKPEANLLSNESRDLLWECSEAAIGESFSI
ncbi:hypothetical protein ACHAXS_004284 [Conticribra weissflogii]